MSGDICGRWLIRKARSMDQLDGCKSVQFLSNGSLNKEFKARKGWVNGLLAPAMSGSMGFGRTLSCMLLLISGW